MGESLLTKYALNRCRDVARMRLFVYPLLLGATFTALFFSAFWLRNSALPEATLNTLISADNSDDMHAVAQHQGTLRILGKKNHYGGLQISGFEQNLLNEYAAQEQLNLVWTGKENSREINEALQSGTGDIAIAISNDFYDANREQILFTLPWGISHQQVVTRVNTGQIKTINDLATRQIAVKKSSPIWSRLEKMSGNNLGMDLIAIPEHTDIEVMLQRVVTGQYDVIIANNNNLRTHLPQYLELRAAFKLTNDEMMVWGVRPDANLLHNSLNRFLNKKHMELYLSRYYREDFPALKKRKLLRLITYQSPTNYFFDKGRFKGFEYELISRFARNNSMRLDVVIANSHEEMQSLLKQGKGDVIAASLPLGSYVGSNKIKFTRPYNYAAPVVVGRVNDSALLDSSDLHGRRIVLSAESPYRPVLERLQQSGVEVEVIDTDKRLSTEAILLRVNQGIYDLTVIGSHRLKSEFVRHLNLQAHFSLSDPLPHVWAVRQKDTQLLSELNTFIKKEYRKGFYNVLFAQYIDNPVIPHDNIKLLTQISHLSPYDEIVRKYAELYEFDWRLIVAQMYQESQFDPKAVSYAGAEGLMQLLPTTAEFMGVSDSNDPVANIYGGVKYLAYLRAQFEDELFMEDRTWFTLAAYNAGYNRVKRARLLAEKMNLNKDRWFDNVEKAMLALSKPYKRGGKLVRYCRCGQTTYYVREIKTLYSNYVRLTQAVNMASTETKPIPGI